MRKKNGERDEKTQSEHRFFLDSFANKQTIVHFVCKHSTLSHTLFFLSLNVSYSAIGCVLPQQNKEIS